MSEEFSEPGVSASKASSEATAASQRAVAVGGDLTGGQVEAGKEEALSAVSVLASGARSIASKAASLSADVGQGVASAAGKAMTLAGDLNRDGVVDREDAKLLLGHAASALSVAAKGAGAATGSVARAPLTKDVATYAAVGAAIALPLPIVGPAIGAAVGAGLGLWRNLSRHETAAPPPDTIAEIERLHALKEKGALTEDEFDTEKHKLLK